MSGLQEFAFGDPGNEGMGNWELKSRSAYGVVSARMSVRGVAGGLCAVRRSPSYLAK